MSTGAYRLLIAVVDDALTPKVVDIVQRVGGQATTVVRGRGRNLIASPTFLGMPIEGQRELLYLVVEADRAHAIAREIRDALDLDRPGQGMVLVVDLDAVYGFVPAGREAGSGSTGDDVT